MEIRGVPIPVTAPESGPSTALKMTVPSTTEEKICKKNDVKARSLLLMALPNEHQLTFNQLQKLVSGLAILGVVTFLEDLNVKFLRSLPSEWDTHVIKRSTGAINDEKNLAFLTTSGASSTTNINTVNPTMLENNVTTSYWPYSKEHMRRFHGMDDRKRSEAIRTREKRDMIVSTVLFSNEAHVLKYLTDSANTIKFMEQEIFKGAYITCTPSTSSPMHRKRSSCWFCDEVNLFPSLPNKTEDLDLLHDDLETMMMKESSCGWKKPNLFAFGQKRSLMLSIVHNTGHFARNCNSNRGSMMGKKDERFLYQQQRSCGSKKDSDGFADNDMGLKSLSEPKELSKSPEVYVSTPITSNEKGVSDPKSKEVEPSCVSHIKTPRQPIKDQATPKVNRKNWNAMMERELGEGYSFTKKKCFVCGSLSHLIKDCDYYEKKMAREAEVKKQRVVNSIPLTPTTFWDDMPLDALKEMQRTKIHDFVVDNLVVVKPGRVRVDRVKHANHFVPKPVQLNGDLRHPVTSKTSTVLVLKDLAQLVPFSCCKENGDLLLRPQQVIIGGTLNQTPIVIDHPLNEQEQRIEANAEFQKVVLEVAYKGEDLQRDEDEKRRKQMLERFTFRQDCEDDLKASKDADPISGKEGVYQIVREDGTDIVYINFGAMLKDITMDDLTELYMIVMNRYGMNGPEDELENVLWEYLKNMFAALPLVQIIFGVLLDNIFNCDNGDEENNTWWRAMPITQPNGCQSTMSNRHKDWLVQEQTALGKDFSNPLMADNLPKIIWFLTHHICLSEELASPQVYGLW
ncbi:hypothetical protein Tco_0421157 [Tanacetum coccineum]